MSKRDPKSEENAAPKNPDAAKILRLVKTANLDPSFAADLIGQGVSIEEARATILDRLISSQDVDIDSHF